MFVAAPVDKAYDCWSDRLNWLYWCEPRCPAGHRLPPMRRSCKAADVPGGRRLPATPLLCSSAHHADTSLLPLFVALSHRFEDFIDEMGFHEEDPSLVSMYLWYRWGERLGGGRSVGQHGPVSGGSRGARESGR